MGMAASQARLLSITARLTNNENTGEAVSYAKQRLADQTQQITNEYNEALDATKLTILTGFNGAEAVYEDISYNGIAGRRMAASNKQYFITDTKGRLLVPEEIADAYKKSGGNYNMFLALIPESLGGPFSQADIYVQLNNDIDTPDPYTGLTPTQQKIHEAWDKYFKAVGIDYIIDEEHPENFAIAFFETFELGYEPGVSDPSDYPEPYKIGDGYAAYLKAEYTYKKDSSGEYFLDASDNIIPYDGYKPETNAEYESNPDWEINSTTGLWTSITTGEEVAFDMYTTIPPLGAVLDYTSPISEEWIPLTYEGTTKETRDLYDYAMAITEAYLRVNSDSSIGDEFNKEFVMADFNMAADSSFNADLKYYRNIFDRIQQRGFVTYTDTPAKALEDDSYIYPTPEPGKRDKVSKSPLKDSYVFEQALRNGTLRLEYYSTTKKQFISTTISEDNCIQEVADERAIAKAERKYTQDMQVLESQDKKFDLELKKLDTEHKALETEYEAVKQVVNKNVESSFKIFS